VRLRDVEPVDVGAYVRMRCDPVMMAELGGPVPREGMAAKVARDVEQAAADAAWIKMIIPDESAPGVVAGSVALWSHEDAGTAMSEIGWMVLPEFQGRGIATTAVRMLLALAREQDRWVWCTRSRRPRISLPTPSAGRPDSDSQENRRPPSQGACSARITG
jgi:RimJ/RimL family protein N-acetyltransferase